MRSLLFLLLTFVVTLSAKADPVDKQQARQQAEKFLQGKGTVLSGEAEHSARRKAPTSKQPLYIFNAADNRGFVIIAGDDRIDPILGYTTQGSFDDSNIPENFRAWLEQTAEEIESVIAKPSKARAQSGPRATVKKVAIHKAINPLIITTWNQGNTDNVYNSHLPLVEGKLPCTGCVATAGAQIMYYFHRDLPSTTQPVPGYSLVYDGVDQSHGANTSKDLPAIQFKWDKMKTTYSYKEPGTPNTEEEDAVADLMLYCGYAAKMNYGLSDKHGGSSASTSTLADGMSKYFGFNPDTWQYVSRSNYSIREWDELIYNELASGRPVIYSGSFYGGHAFICDGYDGAGLYHFNWGWGGSSNGYFKLHATNPYDESSIGFIADIDAIIGLQPSSWPIIQDPNADDTWDAIEVDGFVPIIYDYTIEGSNLSIQLWNNSENDLGFGFGIAELKADLTLRVIDTKYESQEDRILGSWNIRTLKFDVSTYGLSDGIYNLVPINKLKGDTQWKMCKPTDTYFEVQVSGGTYKIIAHPIEDLQVNKFELASGGTPNSAQSFVLNITNNGDNLETNLYVFLGNEADKGEQVASKTIKIAKGNTKEYHIPTYWWKALEAGTYVVRLATDYDGANVLAQTVITISQDLKATKFDLQGPTFSNSAIKVIATVENHAGDYISPLYLFGSATGSRQFFYAAGSAIEKGSSEDITFYFAPNTTGTWTLQIATDQNGENVIGETTVNVTEAPSGNVSLQLVGNSIKSLGNNATYTMSIKNTGNVTNYREISTWLYIAGSNTSIAYKKSPKVTIEPGETKVVSVTFEGLENGEKYKIISNYSEAFNSYYLSWLGEYSFTFTSTEETTSTPGDANADGKVNEQDIVDIVNYILGKATSTGKFDEKAADLNGDKIINAADIVKLVDKLSGGQ